MGCDGRIAPGEWRTTGAAGLASTTGLGLGAGAAGSGSELLKPSEPNRLLNIDPGCASATRVPFCAAGFGSLAAAVRGAARGAASDAVVVGAVVVGAVVVSVSPGRRGALTLGGSGG